MPNGLCCEYQIIEALLEDEKITLTLKNVVVLTCLRLIHRKLPKLVKERCGTVSQTEETLDVRRDSLLARMDSVLLWRRGVINWWIVRISHTVYKHCNFWSFYIIPDTMTVYEGELIN